MSLKTRRPSASNHPAIWRHSLSESQRLVRARVSSDLQKSSKQERSQQSRVSNHTRAPAPDCLLVCIRTGDFFDMSGRRLTEADAAEIAAAVRDEINPEVCFGSISVFFSNIRAAFICFLIVSVLRVCARTLTAFRMHDDWCFKQRNGRHTLHLHISTTHSLSPSPPPFSLPS